jgi:hypothetical protein
MSKLPARNLTRRRRLVAFAAVSLIVAVAAAFLSVFNVSLAPPSVQKRPLQVSAATTRARVQLPPAVRPATANGFETQTKRANLIANLMTTPEVIDRVAALTGFEPDQIGAETALNLSVPVAFVEPNAEHRATELRSEGDAYKIDIQARTDTPTIDVYAQAPSVGEASALAQATIDATNHYLRGLADYEGDVGRPPVTLSQLGPVRAGSVNSTAPLEIAFIAFVTAFGICFGVLVLLGAVIAGWRQAGAPGERFGGVAARIRRDPEAPRSRLDDWPHTTRILPWMLAGFLVLLWLVPINAITVGASLPFELKLDRLVLPIIVLTWLLSLASGGDGAPRWHFTKIHAATSLFVAVALTSVVLNSTGLTHELELELAIKKLMLLMAFFSIFLVVASSVRPTEIRAFMTLILGLATVCAAGVIWEYQFGVDYFYRWSAKLLPSFFHVEAVDTTGFDEIGRPAVIGPADLSLELVAMLSLALPIGLVRLTESKRTRDRLIYGVAIVLLLGAMIATYRKSALLAPVSVVLILLYFRRREMLRLAPLALVLLVTIPILAPNALGSIVGQLEPNNLGVSTVSDRVSDYDAIRPDLLSHPLLGEGYGSYEHTNHRVLDNDLLMRVVETGIIGLVAFVLMIVLVIGSAAPIIRRRDKEWAPVALSVAAASGAFLVMSVLFDVMSFPHTPYILMVMLGFLAAIIAAEKPGASTTAAPRRRNFKPVRRPVARDDAPQAPEREPVGV